MQSLLRDILLRHCSTLSLSYFLTISLKLRRVLRLILSLPNRQHPIVITVRRISEKITGTVLCTVYCFLHTAVVRRSGVTRICCEEMQRLKIMSWGTHGGLRGRVQQLLDD